MINTLRGLSIILILAAVGGCARSATDAGLPTGSAAYSAIETAGPAPTEYLLSANDVLDLKVFNEPEISNDKLRIDSTGFIQVPLAGQIHAEGRTTNDVSAEISQRLAERYIRNPQVTVAVTDPAKRYVTVEGEVKRPGVYELDNKFTLLSAIARAESTTATAKLDQVIIFRTIEGRRAAARFNLADIRGGAAPDPVILSNDVVMVGYSRTAGFWDTILKAAPIFNAFIYLAN